MRHAAHDPDETLVSDVHNAVDICSCLTVEMNLATMTRLNSQMILEGGEILETNNENGNDDGDYPSRYFIGR